MDKSPLGKTDKLKIFYYKGHNINIRYSIINHLLRNHQAAAYRKSTGNRVKASTLTTPPIDYPCTLL